MNIWTIILAAGQSSRLSTVGVTTPKQFLEYDGSPLFWHSASTFARYPAMKGIIFVLPDSYTGNNLEQRILDLDKGGKLGVPWRIAIGGKTRQDSVYNALPHLPETCTTVLIHDAARPFTTPELISRVVHALKDGHEAVIPGIPVTDTIKVVTEYNEQIDLLQVENTLERSKLRAVQTPQGFTVSVLKEAHEVARNLGCIGTDDAFLVEHIGKKVTIVLGEDSNKKITNTEDLAILDEQKKKMTMLPLSSFGYDVHRYGGERPFILGGVPIQTPVTIEAHSDGDTLLHALIDALLGCISAGDIGRLFPDTNPAYKGISSGVLLSEVLDKVIEAGVILTHVDITIIAQTPRISPHSDAIRNNVAKMLHLSSTEVSVKATTEEKLGFTGEKKGIKVVALVSALKPTTKNISL